jgi:hypothetical protein
MGASIPVCMIGGDATENSEQQQGVLWHGDGPAGLLVRLRRMTIVKLKHERNDFVTVIEDEDPDRAYWLNDGTLRPLVPDLSTCLALMIRYAGGCRCRHDP